MFFLNAFANEPIDRLVLKKLREHLQSLNGKAQPVDDHCDHSLSNSDIARARVIGYACIEIFGYLQLPTHGGNQARVIEVLNPVLNWQRVGAPEYLVSPWTSDFRKRSIRVVKGR